MKLCNTIFTKLVFNLSLILVQLICHKCIDDALGSSMVLTTTEEFLTKNNLKIKTQNNLIY